MTEQDIKPNIIVFKTLIDCNVNVSPLAIF